MFISKALRRVLEFGERRVAVRLDVAVILTYCCSNGSLNRGEWRYFMKVLGTFVIGNEC